MSKVKPDVAKQRIESFEKRFGKAHLYLAYHAAFPLALTPDLVYRLWANFQQDIHGEVLAVSWIAVADLLLSSLCDEVGHELYEMDFVVRNVLLSKLKEDDKFGQQRIYDLSDFLLDYVRQQIHSDDRDIRDFAQTQRWTALAYVRPNEAARELALAFSKLDEKDTSELLRMSSLTEIFAEPLSEFQPLLIYARGIKKFAYGNFEDAKVQLEEIPKTGNFIHFAGIDLPIPEELRTKVVQESKRKRAEDRNKESLFHRLSNFFNFLQHLSDITPEQSIKSFWRVPFWRISWFSLFKIFATSGGVTVIVLTIRLFTGMFESSELLFYDQMMRLSPSEEQDKRLLIVKITPEDIEYYANKPGKGSPKNGASLSDEIIYDLLSKLLEKKPRVIGINLYRYAKAEGNLTKRIDQTKTDKRLVFICKFPDNASNRDGGGHNPPPDVPLERVGLSDFISDSDGVVRRQIIQMGTPTNEETQKSRCRNEEPAGLMNSFSLQVAQKYLNENLESGFSVVQPFDHILKPLDISQQGGYSLKNLDGFQIMLNYRSAYAEDNLDSHYVNNIAPQFTVQQILQGKGINASLVKDKIVLIGTTAEGYDNSFLTPFSKTGPEQATQGLFIQAQMISQLVSAVKDNRPLIKVCSIELETLWILSWAAIGAILVQLYKKPKTLIIVAGICILILYISCIGLFILPTKIWIPFTPTVVAFLGTGGIMMFLRLQAQKSSALSSINTRLYIGLLIALILGVLAFVNYYSQSSLRQGVDIPVNSRSKGGGGR